MMILHVDCNQIKHKGNKKINCIPNITYRDIKVCILHFNMISKTFDRYCKSILQYVCYLTPIFDWILSSCAIYPYTRTL